MAEDRDTSTWAMIIVLLSQLDKIHKSLSALVVFTFVILMILVTQAIWGVVR